jgi:predicted DCC family thiol-disulfide oxidoreductase YuxK
MLVAWIDSRRAAHAAGGRAVVFYDGGCGFCRRSVWRLQALDLFGALEMKTMDPVADRMQLVEPGGARSEGFDAYRRISRRLPLMWPLAPWLYLPGMRWVGTRVYDWIARRRNQCGRHYCDSARPPVI